MKHLIIIIFGALAIIVLAMFFYGRYTVTKQVLSVSENNDSYIIAHYQRTIDVATEFLMENEGFREMVYVCPGGKKTIGYGDTQIFKENANIKTITKYHAELRLNSMIIDIYNRLTTEFKYRYSPEQTAAIISLIYRVGFGAVYRSVLFQYLLTSNSSIEDIKKEWLEFQMVGNKKISATRARREFGLFVDGQIVK